MVEEKSKKPARVRKPPKLPTPLEAELQRIAEEILVERTAEARRAAAVELANKLLTSAVALLQHAQAGAVATVSVVSPPPPPKPKINNPCALCGQEGVWKDKPSRFNPKPPWLCKIHAAVQIGENRVEAIGSALADSLRNAQPIDDLSLPEN